MRQNALISVLDFTYILVIMSLRFNSGFLGRGNPLILISFVKFTVVIAIPEFKNSRI